RPRRSRGASGSPVAAVRTVTPADRAPPAEHLREVHGAGRVTRRSNARQLIRSFDVLAMPAAGQPVTDDDCRWIIIYADEADILRALSARHGFSQNVDAALESLVSEGCRPCRHGDAVQARLSADARVTSEGGQSAHGAMPIHQFLHFAFERLGARTQ